MESGPLEVDSGPLEVESGPLQVESGPLEVDSCWDTVEKVDPCWMVLLPRLPLNLLVLVSILCAPWANRSNCVWLDPIRFHLRL